MPTERRTGRLRSGAAARFVAWVRMLFRPRLRTPLFLQIQATECAAACLGSILAYFGRYVSLEELREACAIGRDGCSAADIVRAARQYGLEVEGWRKEPRHLPDMPLPLILFWSFSHFVILEGIGNGRYYLNDPGIGRRTVSAETFDRDFTGVVLSLQPGPEFRTGGTRPGVLSRFWPWLRHDLQSLGFAALSGFLLALSGLVLPLLLIIFVDHVLGNGEVDWGPSLVAAALIAGFFVYLLTRMHQQCLRRLAVRLSIIHSDHLLTHLFRLPFEYFCHRYAGDLIQRVRLIDKIATVGSIQVVGVTVELIMGVLFLGLMVALDPVLALAVAAIGVASTGLMKLISIRRTDENRQMQHEQGLLAGMAMFGLRNIRSLRATGCEDEFFARWAGYQARELLARQRFSELGHVAASLPNLGLAIGGAAVLGLGGWSAMSGEMTLGQLMGFYVIAGNFLRPVGQLVLFADLFKTMEADLQRLDDVLSASEDPVILKDRESVSGSPATLGGRLRLKGRLELRDVTFGYQRNNPPLINGISLTIDVGQRVAVIGPSGSGKSTLFLLLSGMYAPWSGEILIDDTPVNRIPRQILAGSVSMIDQRISLFEGTVYDNLTLWDPTIAEQQLVGATKDALIHDVIMSRPRGYDSLIEQDGRNFSGGERQRLEIARALIRNPSVLLLDEATSALDVLSEQRIDDAVRRRGCTSMIVAHRLSTIRDCDQIIVLDRGQEVQRGTHDELITADGGPYHRLVHADHS